MGLSIGTGTMLHDPDRRRWGRDAPITKQDRAVPLALFAAPLVALAVLAAVRSGFPLDDAYITLHNARALIAGGADPVYAGSTALTGATSAAHLVLVALLGMAAPLPLASKLAAFAAAMIYAVGLERLLRPLRLTPVLAFALYLAALFVAYMPYQLLNGLETGMALTGFVWALVLIDSRWLPLLCGTLPFIRPELAFLAAPLLLRRVWIDRASPARVARTALLTLAAVLPWLFLYFVFTGSPVPATGQAKVAFFAEARLGVGERADLVARLLLPSLFGPLWLSLPALRKGAAGRVTLVFLTCWLALAFFVFPGGLHHNYFRYLSLLVPATLLGWGLILARRPRWQLPAALVLVAWTVVTGSVGIGAYLDRSFDRTRGAAARAIRATVPADAVILVHDAGYLAWALPDRRMVDLVGLKSPASQDAHRAVTATTGSRDAAVAAIAAGAGARYLVALTDAPPFWGTIAPGLRRAGWTLVPLTPVHAEAYTLYRITPPARS